MASPSLSSFSLSCLHSPPSPFSALILAPTRELVSQIHAVCAPTLRRLHGIQVLPITGGVDIQGQINKINELANSSAIQTTNSNHISKTSSSSKSKAYAHGISPVSVLIATPGRLLDLIYRGMLCLFSVSYLVVDEADRMLKMGLKEQVDQIVGQLRPDKQIILCSATEQSQIFYSMTKNDMSLTSVQSVNMGSKNSAKDVVLDDKMSANSNDDHAYAKWIDFPLSGITKAGKNSFFF